MIDPVILVETGQTYERSAITEWWEKNATDPLTGVAVNDKTMVANFALKSLCDEAQCTLKATI